MANTNSDITIAFSVSDSYVPYILVTMKSVLVNHSEENVCFYILTDYISEKKRALLDELINEYKSAQYHILYVTDSRINNLKTGHWTKYAWYRIFLPDLLPPFVNKLLYLDADTLVVGNIRNLFLLDIDDIAIAGCVDPQGFQSQVFERCGYESKKGYICSGVLLMNINFWRENKLSEAIVKYAIDNRDSIEFPDQDSINFICRDCKLVLPIRYGIMEWFYQSDKCWGVELKKTLSEALEYPAIVHFAGTPPWFKEFDHHFYYDEWMRYNRLLRHPVKRSYQTKGWPLVKHIVWRLFHHHRL